MKLTKQKSIKVKKHGINITVYPVDGLAMGIVHIKTKAGHFEEFYHKKSTFTYYVLKGNGTFYLNRRAIHVKSSDIVIAKPKTKIYYMGSMELLLITTPAWTAVNEVHVRYIKRK